jgi:hypothetical protein
MRRSIIRRWFSFARHPALLMAALLSAPGITLAQSAAEPSPPVPATANPSPSACWPEPRLLSKGIAWIEEFTAKGYGAESDGFYTDFGHMITGAGWLSAGPGYRHHLFGDHAIIDVSAALSWRAYKSAQARLEFPYLALQRLRVGVDASWRDFTQVRYFGTGPQSLKTTVSDYRLQASNLMTYATWRPLWKLWLSGGAGVVSRPGVSSSTGPFDRGEPDTMQLFPDAPGAGLTRQPRFVHGDLSVMYDWHDEPSYPTRGGLYRGAWSTYRDQSGGSLTFDRWELEAAQFVPIARNRGVIAFHVWTVLSDTGAGADVPFFFLPTVGGDTTLRGYPNYRFHDRNSLVTTLESRWALLPHVDGAVFVDAGNVAARARDLNLERTSYGFGFRMHTTRTTLARLDVAHSSEGWRVMFKLSDPLRLSRIARRGAALPFVP